jgi:hypothetical protein
LADSHNIITSGFSKYVSTLIKGVQSTIYFALGTGVASWDTSGAPSVSVNQSALYNEVFRMPISEVVYVNPSTDEVSNSPTSRIRIKVEFDNNEYYGITREYGLFAINATGTIGSGTLINYCNHPKITIPTDTTFTKYIYINT